MSYEFQEDELEELEEEVELAPLGKIKKSRKPGDLSRYTPVSAEGYFEQALVIELPQGHVRAYYTPSKAKDPYVLVLHHGAGAGALGFARLAQELHQIQPDMGILAYDARAHGKTELEPEEPLTLEAMSRDLVLILEKIWPQSTETRVPTLFLAGHSLGGAVVAHACQAIVETFSRQTLGGLIVMEMVEATAMDNLNSMRAILEKRPISFDSIEEAIAWHVTSGHIRNLESARISVPSLLTKQSETYTWRTNLSQTETQWPNWFTGLTKNFLSAKTARLLLLAGNDRLDKDLMIAQMQGQFQQTILQGVGHALHEDDPRATAEALTQFIKRNQRLPINVKKVGEA